jgi:hypothetical protein
VRIVTIVAAILAAVFLQLDTVEMYDKLRDQPKLVEALVKSAPIVTEQGGAVLNQSKTNPETDITAFTNLQDQIKKAGFDLAPRGWFARWPKEGRIWWFNHLFGLLLTAGLLTLGAPFWFNLLKNLMSLRPALANLIEKRPTSAPALPAAPATPPSTS